MKNRSLSDRKFASQGGFTLIELLVVVGIFMILIAIAAPYVVGSKNGANATLMLKTSQSAANSWMLIAQSCGTTSDATTSAVMDSGKTMADVVFGGEANVAAAYKACYKQASVIPMNDAAQQKSSGWAVANYPISFTGGGTSPIATSYTGVPDELVLLMVTKYKPELTALASDDSTSSVVQYGSATSGTRNVSVLRVVN